MELKYIQSTIKTDPDKLIEKIINQKPEIDTDAVALFEISNHDVMDPSIRKKKPVTRTKRNNDGSPVLDDAGNKTYATTYEEVNRIPLPIQKFIVEQRVNMLLTNGIELETTTNNDTENNLIEVLKTSWKNNKIDYQLKELLTRQMSETEVAVIVYKEVAEEGYWAGTFNDGKKEKIRINILTSDGGEALFPVFDKFKDMVAFGRAYKLKDEDEEKDIEYFDIYTAEVNYYFRKGAGWELIETTRNIDQKIPIVYFPQNKVEWSDEQLMIGRKEVIASSQADENDYTGNKITVVTAESIDSLPEKSDDGKTIQLTGPGADVKYLESDSAPESIKMERDFLTDNIYMFSGTIDYNALHEFFGSAPSGYAIKLLFQNAHLKASQKESDFGKGIQRLINLMKSLMVAINPALRPAKNMNIQPGFTYFLPRNDKEEVETLGAAVDKGLISQETAVMKCPLVKDGAQEWEKIKKEKEEKAKLLPPVNPNNPAIENPNNPKLEVA